MDIRILESGSKAQDKGDSRNHGLWDPSADVVVFQDVLLMAQILHDSVSELWYHDL